MATVATIRRELDNGSLVQVLAEWDMGSVDMHAVFNGGHAAKSSARAFVGCLQETLQVASAKRLQLLISKYSLVQVCPESWCRSRRHHDAREVVRTGRRSCG
jgi:hypothetical protein